MRYCFSFFFFSSAHSQKTVLRCCICGDSSSQSVTVFLVTLPLSIHRSQLRTRRCSLIGEFDVQTGSDYSQKKIPFEQFNNTIQNDIGWEYSQTACTRWIICGWRFYTPRVSADRRVRGPKWWLHRLLRNRMFAPFFHNRPSSPSETNGV